MSEIPEDIEKVARTIAFWHGARIIGPTQTVASRAGCGNWGHSPELYADRHWREYVSAAEQQIEAILAERERCAKIAEEYGYLSGNASPLIVAEAIRREGK